MDLFEQIETLPQEVQAILKKYENGDFTYEECANLVAELEAVGYTCEYGLDASPYGLKVKNCPICKRNNTRDDFDFPETMNCCDDCGADFLNDGEVILHPKEI